MREEFHHQLAELGEQLYEMSVLAGDAMNQAVHALIEGDVSLAELVISKNAELDRCGHACDQHVSTLFVLQAPVARDLRIALTTLRMAERLEHMGNLARHVAEITRMRHPQRAIPEELIGSFARMGRLATDACRQVTTAITTNTGHSFAAQECGDDGIDRLHDDVVARVETADPPYPIQVAIDVVLVASYLEGFADQAVSVATQLDYVVTG